MGKPSLLNILNYSYQTQTQNQIKIKMLTFTVFTLLASMAMAAPGGGYYRHHYYSHHHAHGMHGMMKATLPAVAPRVAPVGDLVDVAVGAGSFTTLVKIVGDLGLVETLKGVEAATIFAPSDEAFAKLPAGTLEILTTKQARDIIARHVVAGATVKAADVTTGDVETFGGETVGLVKTAEGGVQVTYMGQTVNVVTADVGASNGVIHVIDNVIVGAPEVPAVATRTAEVVVGDLVDVAVGAGAFTTLVKIVGDLGLVETLKGVEAATIFAPSDEAFAKLPAGTLESLTTKQARDIIARHVVAGATVKAADVATGDVETFGGETVGLVKTAEGGVQVTYMGQTVNVVTADVGASNGVIHV